MLAVSEGKKLPTWTYSRKFTTHTWAKKKIRIRETTTVFGKNSLAEEKSIESEKKHKLK